MEENKNNLENATEQSADQVEAVTDQVEVTTATETVVDEAKEKVTQEAVPSMADFEAEIEASMQKVEQGDIVNGEVIGVNESELIVNFGYAADAILPIEEVHLDNNQTLQDVYKVGDSIKAEVIKKDNGDGNVLLSLKKAQDVIAWQKLEKAFKDKETITIKVMEVIKGGLLCKMQGVRGFMPASLASARYVEDLAVFLNQELEVQVIEMDRKANRLIFSRKELEKVENDKKREQLFETLQNGDEYEGVVKKIMDFGVFVNIGVVDGLIRLGDLSWEHIKHPSEVIKEGQKVAVYVMEVDRKKKRVRLGLKDKGANPWDTVVDDFNIGQSYEGEVVRVKDFGAFVALKNGIEGLVHISQLADHHVKATADVVKAGDKVTVKVLNIDKDQQRIRLSMREEAAEEVAPRRSSKPRREKSSVSNLKDYQTSEQVTTSLGDIFKDAMKELDGDN